MSLSDPSLTTHSLTSPSLSETNEILPQNMRALLSKVGKTAEGKTVSIKDSGTFSQETIQNLREKFHTVLTDIKNLHKARTVAWNDNMDGKTKIAKMKQIFVNLKHNARATLIGKKGEAEASERLAEDVKLLKDALAENDYSIPLDLTKEFQEFHNELKAQRPNGYADTKDKVMRLIGDKAGTDETFVKEVQCFLDGKISVVSDCGTEREPSDIDRLTKCFKDKCVDSTDRENKVKEFRELLQSYENRITANGLKNDITEQLIRETREETLRNLDEKTNTLMEKLTALSKSDYRPFGITTVDIEGGYEIHYFTDSEDMDDNSEHVGDDNVESRIKTAVEQLEKDFKDAFPNGNSARFEEILQQVLNPSSRREVIQYLKEFVKTSAEVSKEAIKKTNPVSVEKLKYFFQDAFQGETGFELKTRFKQEFPELKQTAATFESLMQKYRQKTRLSSFDQLEQLLEITVSRNQVTDEENRLNDSAQTEKLYV